MLAFEVEGGREAGRAVIDSLRLPELTASLGSVHTMVVHPPSTSQRQLSEAELEEQGSPPGSFASRLGWRISRTCRPISAPPWRPLTTTTAREPVPAVGAI